MGGVHPKAFGYWPQLDVVRFLAFLGVFLSHGLHGFSFYGQRLIDAGGFGVIIFFVLSSYLITSLLQIEMRNSGTLNIPAFWARRALRIWPLYFGFLLLAVAGLSWKSSFPHLGWFSIFLGNWSCVLFGFPPNVTAPLWSVSVEEQFYLLWPVFLIVFGLTRLRALCLALIAVAVAARLILTLRSAGHTAFWCSTFTQLDSIACGSLLALYSAPGRRIGAAVRVLWIVAGFVAIVAVALIGGFDGAWSIPGYLVVSLAACAFIVAFGSMAADAPLVRPLAYLGRISYGLYVFHTLALAITHRLPGPPLLALGAAFSLTILLAALSFHFFESPFLRLKRRFAVVQS
ncbi:MAG TPA: acyltransferase [Opitutaceae bacterium]|nr:acyltransferase [Opitutaceae bacterium]